MFSSLLLPACFLNFCPSDYWINFNYVGSLSRDLLPQNIYYREQDVRLSRKLFSAQRALQEFGHYGFSWICDNFQHLINLKSKELWSRLCVRSWKQLRKSAPLHTHFPRKEGLTDSFVSVIVVPPCKKTSQLELELLFVEPQPAWWRGGGAGCQGGKRGKKNMKTQLNAPLSTSDLTYKADQTHAHPQTTKKTRRAARWEEPEVLFFPWLEVAWPPHPAVPTWLLAACCCGNNHRPPLLWKE